MIHKKNFNPVSICKPGAVKFTGDFIMELNLISFKIMSIHCFAIQHPSATRCATFSIPCPISMPSDFKGVTTFART